VIEANCETCPGTAETIVQTRYTETYEYGTNAGSGAFTLGGWQPTREVNPRGFVTDSYLDASYRTKTVIQRLGGTEISYTDGPQAGEPTVTTEYNDVHNKISETTKNEDAQGVSLDQSLFYFYDSLHRVTVTALDLNGINGTVLTGATGEFIEDAESITFDDEDFVTRTVYDKASNVLKVIDPEQHVVETDYDGASRNVTVRQNEVDNFDRGPYTTTGARETPTTTFVYDDNSNMTRTTDPHGTKTEYTYDARNRMVKSIVDLDGDGEPEERALNPEDSDDIVNESLYDLADNVILTRDPRVYLTI